MRSHLKSLAVTTLFLNAVFLGACSTLRDSADDPGPPGPYLEQPLPGDTAVLFAPGLVSVEGRYEFAMSFSPDGRELLFTSQYPGGPSVLVHFSVEDGGWVGPREVQLSGGQRASEMEAFFTPDGHRIYFAAYDDGLDVRIWAVDRHHEGWGSPRQLGSPLADHASFFPTTTAGGTVYYSNVIEGRIFRAEMVGDSVGTVADTGLEAMHAFVAPDESFVLLDVRDSGGGLNSDIFISFRQSDGSWSQLSDLGPAVNTEYSETCPSLSPDGRLLFFSRYDEENDVSNIYWVNSDVIQRPTGRINRLLLGSQEPLPRGW